MSKPEKIYILSSGRMYNDYSCIVGAAKTKAKAAKLCRDKGCRWDSEDQLFCNVEEDYWIRVEVLEVGCPEGYGHDVSYGRTKQQREPDKVFGTLHHGE